MTGVLLPQQNQAWTNPSNPNWTRDRLQALIKSSFGERRVVIVANRTPLPSGLATDGAEASQPVSGLLSALFKIIDVIVFATEYEGN